MGVTAPATLDSQTLAAYRATTYRLHDPLTSPEAAVDFVNERGFVFFWPIKNATLPSLWAAVAGDRPVADAHDDPGHITWGWKDAALGRRWWYYAKVLRKKATLIALELAPYFYALSQNFGSPEEDYLNQYLQGKLSQEAKAIYEALLTEGPLHTIALRKTTFMASKERNPRFERALTELQTDFKILPVGVAQAGSWRYAFIYDCVHRHYPELPQQARSLGIAEAQRVLVRRYFEGVGAAQSGDVRKVFQWPKAEVQRALDALTTAGRLRAGLTVPQQRGTWYALPELAP